MTYRVARILLMLGAPLLVAASCTPTPEAEAHAECRRDWIATFHVIFTDRVTNGGIRYIHTCMEKRGFKRLYDHRRCKQLRASVDEPRCFIRIEPEGAAK